MATINREKVLSVHHWADRLFSFTATRTPTFRFENGHFTMVGIEIDGKPLMRAYSMVSANWEEHLEFLSIKVPNGPLTSRLQYIEEGDEILVNDKATGTLVTDHLLPGKHLYLVSTGTGIAPFMSIIKNPAIYEQFEKVILLHGVRYVAELAYQDFIAHELPTNEYFGDEVKGKLIYYPSVTREDYIHEGRVTELMESGALFRDIGLPEPNLDDDRFMICGGPDMLRDTTALLEERGFTESRHGHQAHYVIERAFVER